MHKHATLSAWKRDHHDGSYSAEIEGWKLEVHWHPEAAGKRRGFSWKAAPTSGDGPRLASADDAISEEIELAMADAELAAHRASLPSGAAP